ncbi:hypothetical protein NX79_06935 [Xanthomonas vasicola]|nr:hypothetical protein NX04_08140 [Xanthomonas vasicola]KGR46245.1 hypothetical protein NX05_05775 [Xanthomonas vasicola]KGR61168.1 hypothetical protein NX79_06935 [Xanthomonas vasicola]
MRRALRSVFQNKLAGYELESFGIDRFKHLFQWVRGQPVPAESTLQIIRHPPSAFIISKARSFFQRREPSLLWPNDSPTFWAERLLVFEDHPMSRPTTAHIRPEDVERTFLRRIVKRFAGFFCFIHRCFLSTIQHASNRCPQVSRFAASRSDAHLCA